MRLNKSLPSVGVLVALVMCSSVALADSWWQRSLEAFRGFQSQQKSTAVQGFSQAEISAAFKDALELSTEKVVAQLGVEDGFNADPTVHISLPSYLLQAKTVMTQFGFAAQFDELELQMNRAAEQAMPEVKQLIVTAINNLSFDDIQRIYTGPADSATQYFKAQTSAELNARIEPIVEAALRETGAIRIYDQMTAQYQSIPFVATLRGNLNSYVVTEANEGLFHYMAEYEAAFRNDPAKQGTELMKKVFGQPR